MLQSGCVPRTYEDFGECDRPVFQAGLRRFESHRPLSALNHFAERSVEHPASPWPSVPAPVRGLAGCSTMDATMSERVVQRNPGTEDHQPHSEPWFAESFGNASQTATTTELAQSSKDPIKRQRFSGVA